MRTLLESLSIGHTEKIQSRDEAALTIADWKKDGLTVGFTNGCYDLLHPGHLFSIGQTHKHCDRLVIGLNSDASVSVLKGPNRPVQNEEARALILGAMEDVHLVVMFGEETPHELIQALVPDVLVKGKDYTGKLVVGQDIVETAGGKVILADMMPGVSTTSTITKMNRAADDR